MADTPVVTDAVRLVRVLFSPGAVFEEMKAKEKPPVWSPWLVISILFTVTSLLLAPYQQRAQAIMLEQMGRTPPAGGGAGMIGAIVGTPIVVLALSALMAGILYVIVMALGGESTFRKLWCVVLFSWPVAVIQQALAAVVLRMRGVDSVRSMRDVQVSFGADLLLPADMEIGMFTRTLLMGVSPLYIWSCAIVAVGIMVLTASPKGRAWTAAIGSYLIGLVIMAGLASVFAGMMGG